LRQDGESCLDRVWQADLCGAAGVRAEDARGLRVGVRERRKADDASGRAGSPRCRTSDLMCASESASEELRALGGTIEQVRHHNEEDGWTVARLRVGDG